MLDTLSPKCNKIACILSETIQFFKYISKSVFSSTELPKFSKRGRMTQGFMKFVPSKSPVMHDILTDHFNLDFMVAAH